MKKINDKIPVIILDCNIKSQAGIVQSFGRKKIPIIAVSCTSECAAFYSKYITKKVISPRIEDSIEEYIKFLLSMKDRGVLIYSGDVSSLAMSKYRNELLEAGFLLNIPKFKNLQSVFDKWHCYNTASSLGIAVAKSQLIHNIEEIESIWNEFRKPVILKGTTMAGGMYPRFYNKKNLNSELIAFEKLINSSDYSERKSDIMLQEWLEYEITDMWSCETVYNQQSEPMGFFTIKRIRSSLNNHGQFTSGLYAGEHVHSEELIELTKKILSFANWKGFAHVEFFYVPTEKKFYLTEVNPRLPGYSYYPSHAGYDLAYYYYADLVGEKLDIPKTFQKSLFFLAFHFSGDITEGIYHIFKGNLKLFPFLKSYFRIIFQSNTIKILDPIRMDDLKFTLMHIYYDGRFFFRKVHRYIKRKLFFHFN